MLVISSVTRDHDGNYSCTAKNQAGVASETTVLRVNGSAQHHREADMATSLTFNISPSPFLCEIPFYCLKEESRFDMI